MTRLTVLAPVTVATIIAAAAPHVRADVIATVPVPFSVIHIIQTPSSPVLQQIELNLIANLNLVPPNFDHPLFTGVTLTQAHIGQSFSATPANDPNFADVATILTNGQDNAIGTLYTTLEQNGGLQRRLFGKLEDAFFSPVTGTTDLSGYTLTRITERLDSLTILPDVTDAFGNHGPQFNGQITLTFEGTPVPEPTFPATLAFAAMVQRRRRR